MPKLVVAISLAAMVMLSWNISHREKAIADGGDPVYMALIDRHASGASQANRDLTESFVGLLSSLREGERLGYMTAGDEAAIAPEAAGSAQYKSAHRELVNRLRDASPAAASDLPESLAHAHELMRFEGAGAGSALYLVSGGALEGENPSESRAVADVVAKFNASGWRIVSVSLPEPSGYAADLMAALSDGTGGEAFPLTSPEDLKAIADGVLSADAHGTLFEIGEEDLSPNEVFTASLDIAPSTTETSLVFFKEGATGSLSLKNPSGVEGRPLSNVVETPHVVVWTLEDPAPGTWSVDARGREGFISAWHYPKNKLDLELASLETAPYDQRLDIVAYISDGGERVSVEGAEMRAAIRDAAGQTVAYPLNDDGELGDSIAGDGYYSATAPPLGAEGEYQVELSLHWPEYNHSISTRKQISAQGFPTLAVNSTIAAGDTLTPGDRVRVATVEVQVKGQPYAIPTDRITAQVSSSAGGDIIEIVPQRLLNTGHASAFDVMFTPVGEQLHTLQLRLDLEYAAREYSYTTDSIVLESAVPPPPAPVVPAPEPPPAVVPAAPPAPDPAPEPPAVPAQPSESGFPMAAVYALAAVAGLAVVGAVVYVGYAMSRPRPYGMLYDDQDNLLADLSDLHRSANASLTSKNMVRGEELGIPELAGLSFHFTSNEVELRSSQTEPSIRINNRPLLDGEHVRASDHSWIGTQGKLFSLRLTPDTPDAKPAVAKPQPPTEPTEPVAAPSVGDD